MIWLTWAALLAWAGVVFYMAPSAVSIYVRTARVNDPFRFVCLLFGLVSIAGLGRRIAVIPGDGDWLLIGVLLAHVAVAGLSIVFAQARGRGDRV